MGFLTRHQPRSSVNPNFSKMGFRYQNLSFSLKFWPKTIKSSTKFHCLKTSSGNIVAQSTTYRSVLTFWQGMSLFP